MAEPKWRTNTGERPKAKAGKRAVVKLRCGRICGVEPVTSVSPTGWDLGSTRWSLNDPRYDSRFDIEFFYLV